MQPWSTFNSRLLIYFPGHAGVRENEAGRSVNRTDIITGLQLGRAEVLRSLRRFLAKDTLGNHSDDHLNSFATPWSRSEYDLRTPCSRCYTQPRHSLSSASLLNFYAHAVHSTDITGWHLLQVKSILLCNVTALWNLCERYLMKSKITNLTRCGGSHSVSHCLCVESRCWLGCWG